MNGLFDDIPMVNEAQPAPAGDGFDLFADIAMKPSEMRAYEPSIRDRVAAALMPDNPRESPLRARFVESLTGSRGLGHTGFSAADVFPPTAALFGGNEAQRAAEQGDVTGTVLNSLAMIPAGGLIKTAAPAIAAEMRAAAPAVAKEAAPAMAAVEAAPMAAERAAVKIVTPDQAMEITAKPELVELATLKEATGRFQPRDRSRAEYVQEARERASRLDPEQLGVSRVSDSGAPIVLNDGTVISGNGRTLSIQEVYANPQLAKQAEAYRASLGPEAAGMKEPVMIMRAEGLAGDDATRFADLSNRGRIASMSATERAQRDATSLGETITLYKGGDFTSPNNQDFMRAFMDKVATRTERASLSKDGQLTQEGAARMRNAVLASAYDDAPTLARMLESTDDNIRSLTGALTDVAPKFAALKSDIKAGMVLPEMDATPSITEAVKMIADLRSRRVRPADFFAQKDAFGGTDPFVEAWVRAFYNDDLSRAATREKMTAVLDAYAEEALKHRPGGLFPDETTAKDVLTVAKKAQANEPIAIEQASFFGTAQDVGKGLPEGGQPAAGPEVAVSGDRAGQRSSATAGDGSAGNGIKEQLEAQRAALADARAAYKAATGKDANKDWPIARLRKEAKAAGGK